MSAWIVSEVHINLLVEAGLTMIRRRISNDTMRWYFGTGTPGGYEATLDDTNADEVGRMLWVENYASVNHRYPNAATEDGELPAADEDFDDPDVLLYTHTRIIGTIDPVVVLKSISCYEYQSCEHAGWKTSSAKAFCEQLRSHCIDALPGYGKAPWGFDDPAYFTARVAHGFRL